MNVVHGRRVGIVTGAGSGIGRATAVGLLRDGATVVALDIDAPALDALVAAAGADAERLVVHTVDVGDWEKASRTLSRVYDEFGRLDYLVNSAGVVHFAGFEAHTRDDWIRMLEVNVLGTVGMCRAAAQLMRASGGGRIVNVASWFGKIGKPMFSAYCASKFALIGLSQSLAFELANDGITVNTVCPGTIDRTAMRTYSDDKAREAGLPTAAERTVSIPIPRLGCPEDVWNAIRFLLGEESGYITGQSLNVTGGLWMH